MLTGGVLTNYSVLAVILILFHGASNRVVLGAALVALYLPDLMTAGLGLVGLERPAPLNPELVARLEDSYGYFGVMWRRVINLRSWWPLLLFDMSHLFLLGLYVGRTGILQRLPEHRAVLQRVVVIGFLITVAGLGTRTQLDALFADLPAYWGLLTGLRGSLVVAAQVAFYAASVALIWLTVRGKRFLAPLASAGRMALTNYLSVSLVETLLLYDSPLRGTLRPSLVVPIAALFFGVQLLWSRWWLARHRYGPMEWVWRSLTYGRLEPMRHKGPVLAASSGTDPPPIAIRGPASQFQPPSPS